jgi:3-phenylpropionate/cinnamic acid dioxygenase small subunit
MPRNKAAVAPGPMRSDLLEIEEFLFHEGFLLDQRRFEEWEELFTADAYYWVPIRADQQDPLSELSIFYDDRALMRTRIERLRHPRIHIQTPPSTTCHFTTNIRIDPAVPDGAEMLVRSSLMVAEYRLGQQRSFAAQCQHALRREEDKLKIAWKRVDLINAGDVFDPIGIFF